VSLARTIADADGAVIAAIAGAPTVVVREQPDYQEGDPLPLVVVTEADEQTLGYLFGGAGFHGYVVLVTVLVARNQLLEGAGRDTAKDFREKVRKRLVPDHTATPGAILAGVSQVWDIDAVDLPGEPRGTTRPTTRRPGWPWSTGRARRVMAKAKADPEQAPVPAPPAAQVVVLPAAGEPGPVLMFEYTVRGPRGTFRVVAATEDVARHWYKNETALAPELVKDLLVTRE
jgi:hypothetical protein